MDFAHERVYSVEGVTTAVTLSSYSNGDMCSVWELKENKVLKDGVRCTFLCFVGADGWSNI